MEDKPKPPSMVKHLNPGIDGVTAKLLNELPKKRLDLFIFLFNVILKQIYWPKQLKSAEIILIPKLGKDNLYLTFYLIVQWACCLQP